MKRIFTLTVLMSIAFLAASCSKEPVPAVTPEDLFNGSSKLAETTIYLNDDSVKEPQITDFARANVYRNSDKPGQSWLSAWSGGKMVYDCFFLSIYFQNIENMKIGEALDVSRFVFGFSFSSNSEDYTHKYSGRITLADKGDDYVILEFHNVGVSCNLGGYLMDGYLYCQLEDELTLEWE